MNPINVLIAEDHKLFRQLLIPTLKEHGVHTIGEAEHGLQLLSLLESLKPDLILLDIAMPHMNGTSAFLKIKETYPQIKIIVISNHTETAITNFFYSKGVDAFLSKNTDLETIIETIKNVHENRYVRVIVKETSQTEAIRFSQRETELIPLILDGKSNKEIADVLNIGNKTVEAHKKSLFKKTKTQSAIGFVIFALKSGFNYLK